MTPTSFGRSTDAAMLAAQQAMSRGQWAEAERALREVTTQHPSLARAWADLGHCLRLQQKRADAEAMLTTAIVLHPADATLFQVLGTVYLDDQRGADAARAFGRAIELQPKAAPAYYGLAVALQRDGRLCDAVRPAQTAADLEPAQLQYQLMAAVLVQWDSQTDAVSVARRYADRAAALGPQTTAHWQLLATALGRLGDYDRALAATRQAVRVSPQSASAHWQQAKALLKMGAWAEGWAEFEWRLIAMPHLRREFVQPQWQGEPLSGRTILLHAEGGLGDTVQFVRLLPWVRSQAATVLLECQPPLSDLLSRSVSPTKVFARGQALPSFDVHLPLQGLPRRFGWTSASDAQMPYLVPAPDAVAAWARRVASLPAGPKVGIVWAGSFRVSEEADDRSRSAKLFQPLADIPGVTLISLQKGDDAPQVTTAGFPLVDWTDDIDTFDDLAALVSVLDLCVCVDTGVAHLAGALGKPVWTLIPATPDFRWMLDRVDTPWYPTMRLYPQAIGQPWTTVFGRIADDLRAIATKSAF